MRSERILRNEEGVVKKVEAKSFADVRRSGIIAINLKGGDKLVSAHLAAMAIPFP
jgi:DNA gyrase subunit A